ncbi:MAG: BACON domain-containing protein [Acidobacteriota bacterium]|nr:BACON domain-containing protein [Acidobacteriota bacterium]
MEVSVPAVVEGPSGDAAAVQTLYYADETLGELEFNAAGEWTVTGAGGGPLPPWIAVLPASGTAGDQKLGVTLDVNVTGADREAEVEVTSGGVTVKVVIKQAHTTEDGEPFGDPGAVTLAISPETRVLDASLGSTTTFSVTAMGTGFELDAPTDARCVVVDDITSLLKSGSVLKK